MGDEKSIVEEENDSKKTTRFVKETSSTAEPNEMKISRSRDVLHVTFCFHRLFVPPRLFTCYK